VNNAGIAFFRGDLNEEIAKRTFSTNVIGTFDFTGKILELMNDNGKIIMIGSLLGKLARIKDSKIRDDIVGAAATVDSLIATANLYVNEVKANAFRDKIWPRSAYAVSKVLVNAYPAILARTEIVRQKKIQVYSCCPGWVRTDLGGPKASKSIEEGVVCPMFLINLPYVVTEEYQGKFFSECKVTSFD
jgi:NAD(P)-dependent dehydrogenase (short-subunit alcohol dehydrogenase family)